MKLIPNLTITFISMSAIFVTGCTPESLNDPSKRAKEILASAGIDPSEYDGVATPPSNDENFPEVNCPEGQYWSGEACLKTRPDCQTFQEATMKDGIFLIPRRTEAEVCYYVKMFDSVPLGNTIQSRPQRSDVVTRLHGYSNPGSNPYVTTHPWIMGQRNIRVQVFGPRNVMLSADNRATQNIRVDNFVLVEIMRATSAEKIVWAAGSEDVRFYDDKNLYSMKLNNTAIPFEVFAPYGTSEFQPVEFTSYVPFNEPIDISISALDCGGSEESTDGYLIFK